MPKITVELDDNDMAELDAEARAKCVSVEETATQAIKAYFNPRGRAKDVPATTVVGGAGHQVKQTGHVREGAVASADHAVGTDSLASRQAARRAALLPAFGMWTDDDIKPKDGVAYQNAMRAEW